jgi:hypothetical protein
MGRIPKGWRKSIDTESVTCYSKKNYSIYMWKVAKPRKQFVVEPFRNLSNYKRRLFKKEFNKMGEAKRFAWNLMKQKEIRSYYSRKGE